ncbi:MAG: peptidoglycan DD-metalloendopeptidase family protein [Patescibacteria group bacterium]
MNLFSISDFRFRIFSRQIAKGATPEELKSSISEKAEELKKINAQISETQKNLEETKEEGKTLKKEITNVDTRLNQITLNIKASEILIDRLKLEVESVSYDIEDTENKINSQKEAIASTLIKLQKKEDETPLTIFLKNKNLAESIFEAQSLNSLSLTLTKEVTEMQILKDDLEQKKDDLAGKKTEKENEAVNLKNKKSISEDIKKDKQYLLEQTKNQEKSYQQKLSELKKLQDEIAEEIDIFEEELRLKIDPTLLPIPRPGVLGLPIQIPPARGTFSSEQKHGFTRNRGKRYHNGLDFGAPIGTPLLAAETGTIIAVGDQDNYRVNGKRTCYKAAYGKFVMVKHENNLTTLYAHLSRWIVNVGDKVEKGQIIGYSGNTGLSTGPHLHFVVYATNTIPPATPGFYEGTRSSRVCGPLPVGGDIDPLKYLDI